LSEERKAQGHSSSNFARQSFDRISLSPIDSNSSSTLEAEIRGKFWEKFGIGDKNKDSNTLCSVKK